MVRHNATDCSGRRGKKLIKINMLKSESRTHNPLVLGSSPSGPTNKINHLALFLANLPKPLAGDLRELALTRIQ